MLKIIAIIACWCLGFQVFAQPNIIKAEYFIDTDPGFGNGTNITITPSANIINNTFSVPAGSLTKGVHSLFIRSLDANGKWSISDPHAFINFGLPVNIVKAEYFIDTDPGFGNGTNISITPGINIANNTFSIPASALIQGMHTLFIRSRDVDGKWSLSIPHVFINFGLPVNIVKAEYFIDTDPGFGNATNISITPGITITNNTFNIPVSALSQGVHTLFLRSRNSDGKWSISIPHVFYNFISASITKAEYFIDTDPGFGNGTNIPITSSLYINSATFTIPASSLLRGVHSLFLRSKDSVGKWSITNQHVFFNFGSPDSVTRWEYFIDSDPGFGNAVPVTFTPAFNIPDFIAQVNITGLSAGIHKFYVRSKANRNWSITNEYDFPITATTTLPYININSISKKVMCAGDNFRLTYDARGTFNAGNSFTAQLSDENGSFVSPVNIGQITSTVSSQEIICTIPTHRNEGANYRVRMVSSNPVVIGATCDTLFTIHDRPFAQTITGRSLVNGTYTWPYSVPNVATSSFYWLVNGGTFSPTTTNNISVSWPQPSTPSTTGKIQAVETNQFGCIGDTSNLNITIYKLRIDQTVSDLALCRGEALLVNYSVDGSFDAGNNLTAQLSNSGGSFASPVNIGTKVFSTSGVNQTGVINANIPPNTALGNGYRVRVVSSVPSFTGTANTSDITVNDCIATKHLSNGVPPSIDSVSITYTPLSNVSGPATSPFYTNYTIGPTTTATVYRGDRFELSLKVNNPGSYNIAAWVDYNNNNIFEPAENVILSSRTVAVGSDWAQVPLVLSTTNARLRIRVSTDLITANDCCKTLTNGETEDYTISFNQVLNCRWIGRVSTDWQNPANWSCGIVPDNTKSVMIPAGTPFSCEVISVDATVDRLWIQSGATITVKLGRKLNMNGTYATITW